MSSIELGEQLALDQAGQRAGGFRVTLESNNDTNAAGDVEPGRDRPGRGRRVGRQRRRRLHRRLRLGRDRDVAADHQRRRDPPGQPVEPLPGPHRPEPRRRPRRPACASTRAATTPSRGSCPPTQRRRRRRSPTCARAGVTRLYVLEDVSDPFDADVAELIANDAPARDHASSGSSRSTPRPTPRRRATRAIAATIAAARADAVVLGGRPGPGALALWSELHTRAPARQALRAEHARDAGVPRRPGRRRERDLRDQPDPRAAPVPAARAGACSPPTAGASASPPTPYALYGYDAMRMCSRAIERARSRSRAAVRSALLPPARDAPGARRLPDLPRRRHLAGPARRLHRERGRAARVPASASPRAEMIGA